jgi:hypothetical protein
MERIPPALLLNIHLTTRKDARANRTNTFVVERVPLSHVIDGP